MVDGDTTPAAGRWPLFEFDPSPEAVIEPARAITRRADMPAAAVLCFFQDVIETWAAAGRVVEFACLRSEIGRNPVYRLSTPAGPVALLHPGVGAPLAAGFLEEAIALGGRAFVACGGAGVLDSAIDVGAVLVPTAAVRDEGTSYHYLPPSREVRLAPRAVAACRTVLEAHGVPHRLVKTWTTDGLYRETAARMARRRAEGCVCVEMETAALAAVAEFRGVAFAQLLYGGDDLGGETWDSRQWTDCVPVRERLLELAIEIALALALALARSLGGTTHGAL